jgi:hypothetical protein
MLAKYLEDCGTELLEMYAGVIGPENVSVISTPVVG